jgi:hypothetical protein
MARFVVAFPNVSWRAKRAYTWAVVPNQRSRRVAPN